MTDVPDTHFAIVPWTVCSCPKNWGDYSMSSAEGWYSTACTDLEPTVKASGEGRTLAAATRDAEEKLQQKLIELSDDDLTEQQRTNKQRILAFMETYLSRPRKGMST